MKHIPIFRIITSGLVVFLIQGCSWTFVHDVSRSSPSSETEQTLQVSQCRDNLKSIAPAVDLTATILQLPGLVLGGILLGDKHDGINEMGTSLVVMSGGLATLFLLSMKDGKERKSRCKEIINSIGAK